MDKISVIVPVYNVEEYLSRCVDSIINQTYKELEIILVDDGSPDNSGKICDEYAKKDERIKVVHKKNGGLSSARNAGLNVSTGKYVSFIDSDDWIEKELYSVLTDIQKNTNADIVLTTFSRGGANFKNNIENKDKLKHISSCEYYKKICLREVGTSVCGSLFKNDLFRDLRFDETKLNEDFVLCSELFLKENLELVKTAFRGYHYFYREGSISNKFGKSIIDSVFNTEKSISLAIKYNKSLEKYCRGYNAYQSKTALIVMPESYRKEHKDFEKFCLKNLKENMRFGRGRLFKVKDVIFCMIYIYLPFLGRFIKRVIKN